MASLGVPSPMAMEDEIVTAGIVRSKKSDPPARSVYHTKRCYDYTMLDLPAVPILG